MPSQTVPYLALIPYAAIAVGLAITLLLFLSLKWEMQRSVRRERKRVDELLDRLKASSEPTAGAAEPVFVPAPMRPGFNINRRVHIQRLLRRGHDPARIAATLGVSRSEVELLVRVQRLVSPAGETSTTEPAAIAGGTKRAESALPAVAGE